jgi:ribosomal protein S14
MIFWAAHPFARRQLNVLDENGNERCAICGRPRSVHREQEATQ